MSAKMLEAELFKTELSAHSIPVFLEGEGAGVSGIPDVGAGVPVLVPEEYADQAAELIAELESAKPEGNALGEKENIFEEEEEADDEEVDDEDDLDEEDDEEEDDDEKDDDEKDDEKREDDDDDF